MFAVLAALASMTGLLLLAEVLWHRKLISGEYARKFVHILGGSMVAFWPYFMSLQTVQYLALAGMVLWLLTQRLQLSFALKDVNRPTIGELLYPLSVFFIAHFAQDTWVFTTAVLFLALADGMAAVVGKRWGTKKTSFTIWKGRKSLAGNLAYVASAYVAICIGMLLGGSKAVQLSPILVVGWMPLAAVLLENVSPYGSDNLTAPLFVTAILNLAVTISLL